MRSDWRTLPLEHPLFPLRKNSKLGASGVNVFTEFLLWAQRVLFLYGLVEFPLELDRISLI